MEDCRHSFIAVPLAFSLGLFASSQVGLGAQDAAAGDAAQTTQGALVFSRSMAGTYLATPGGQAFVSYAHGDYIHPRLLPGEHKVLVNSRRGGRPGIWMEDVGSDERERICDGDQVSVSPDGTAIVFQRESAIVHRDLGSGTERVLSPSAWVSCSHPSFCPGGRVLFLSTDQNADSVCIVDPAAEAAPRRLFDGEIRSAPECSPDGRTIAYQNGAHIYLFDIPTERHRRVTCAGGVQSWPMWSSDGQSLAYLQSPGPIDGPWHVYRVKIDDPGRTSLILRNVEPAPDWNGLGFSAGMVSELKGDAVRLWCSDGPVRLPPEAEELPEPEGGWTTLPEKDGTTQGDLLVECEWGGLYLSAATGKAFLARKRERGLAQTTQISLLGEGAIQAQQIESMDVSAPGVDEVQVTAALRSADGDAMEAAFLVCRTRPLVEVKPTKGVTGVLSERLLQLAVVPDRLAGDLIYDPAAYASADVPLPRSPFVLGMPTDTTGLLMVVTPSAGQTVQLVKGNRPDAFAGFRARCESESVFVSFLPGDHLWHATKAGPADEGDGWSVTWSNAFPAQWRLAMQSPAANIAMMARMDTPTSEKSMPLEGGQVLTSVPRHAITYTYGRSQNTPLDEAMPTDILRDALGIHGASALLDIEGIRTYRHAGEPVFYKDPRVALKVISWIRGRQRPGAQEKIDHICRDIVLSLQGLDARIGEYESFVAQAKHVSQEETTQKAPGALLQGLSEKLAGLDERLRKRPVPPMERTAAKIAEFRRNTGAAYMPFSSSVTAALYPRVDRLKAHRAFAKNVRRDAGLALASSPESRDACEQLRTLAGQVLRNRYYLEEDWLGEEPLGGPEVSYEKISDL